MSFLADVFRIWNSSLAPGRLAEFKGCKLDRLCHLLDVCSSAVSFNPAATITGMEYFLYWISNEFWTLFRLEVASSMCLHHWMVTWHVWGVVMMTCKCECEICPLGGSLPPHHNAHLRLLTFEACRKQPSFISFLLFKMPSAFIPVIITHASTDILYCDEKQALHQELISVAECFVRDVTSSLSIIVELGQAVHLHDWWLLTHQWGWNNKGRSKTSRITIADGYRTWKLVRTLKPVFCGFQESVVYFSTCQNHNIRLSFCRKESSKRSHHFSGGEKCFDSRTICNKNGSAKQNGVWHRILACGWAFLGFCIWSQHGLGPSIAGLILSEP